MSRFSTSPGAVFLVIALGQIISIAGSTIAGFCLGVWIYQRTGSVTQYGMVSVAVLLPPLLAVPLAGGFVDRHDRRRVLAAAEAMIASCSLALAVLHAAGWLTVWTALPWLSLASASGAFLLSALGAIVTVLVPPADRARANALLQFGTALSEITAPLIAASLMTKVSLGGLLLVDVASSTVAIGALLAVRVPRPAASKEGARAPVSPVPSFRYGWRYICNQPGLLGLLLLFAGVNFNMRLLTVLVAPLVLSLSDVTALGRISTAAGLGMLAGSLTMMIWGGPKRAIHGVLGSIAAQGLIMMYAPVHRSLLVVAAGAFGVLFTTPIAAAASQAIWQRRVPADIQGRVFAVRSAVARATPVLAAMIAGPLADRLFEPAMSPGGALARWLGPYLGIGHGRGIALMFAILGLGTISMSILGYMHPDIRGIDDDAALKAI